MNRAILIVICDFLVSAMLSMMTGMVPAHVGGSGVGLDGRTTALLLSELQNRRQQLEATREKLREAQQKEGFSEAREQMLEKLAGELADTLLKSEQLEERLRLTRTNTGALTPEQLQRRLDREIRNRHLNRIRLEEAQSELAALRKNYAFASGNLAKLSEDYAAARQKISDTGERLDETRESLKETQRDLEEQRRRLESTGADLAKTRETLAARETALAGMRESLKETLNRMGEVSRNAQKTESDLAYTRGRLSATERDLAESRSQLERTRRLAAAREVERNEARTRLDQMSKALKSAVTELSRTKASLDVTKQEAENTGRELIATRGEAETTAVKLKSAEERLAEAEQKLRSDVLDRYHEAAVRLDLALTEERLLLNQHGGGVYYLPLVKLGGKNVLVASFHTLAGDLDTPLKFDRILELTYRTRPGDAPEEGTPGVNAAGPLLTVPEEPRIAALEVAPEGRVPLETMTIGKLRQRGLQNLYLFKTSSFGKESAALGGRCSIDLSAREPYLYIRNTGRGTGGNELRAEPGDLVLSREGDFIGVVVAIENFDFGRRQEAKCFVFPDEFSWEKAGSIPIVRRPGEEYFSAFGGAVRRHLEQQVEKTEKGGK
ncbi:hypothetical protein [uncultured Victivallis sp.]|uniref:hypothetical protein n=1 Tax=uncultured Victivallis sp. TaxID=354118 RepID=UPI0025EC6D39|nr:hypothetical protein [uncultured Victivallis sp.]